MTSDNERIIITMIEELKALVKGNKSQQQPDFSKVEQLTERMEGSLSATNEVTEQLTKVIEQARKPIVSERRITIDIESKGAVFLFIGMLIIITGLSSWLYLATRPNYDRIDNDLKYRYIKMKGEATPERLSELENIFEINRDNSKIRQMDKDVEGYERAVKEKVALDEQARLRQLEAEELNKEAEKIKGK